MSEEFSVFMHRELEELKKRVAALEQQPRLRGMFGRQRDDLRDETHEQMVARVREWAKQLNMAGDDPSNGGAT